MMFRKHLSFPYNCFRYIVDTGNSLSGPHVFSLVTGMETCTTAVDEVCPPYRRSSVPLTVDTPEQKQRPHVLT